MSFPTTHWSQLALATLHGEETARSALEKLCRSYWRPVYCFVCSRGYDGSEAEDLTQEFMLHILNTSLFRRADRLRGQFRSFLLGALVRFLCDARDRRNAQKRGGLVLHVCVENEEVPGPEYSLLPDIQAAVFDREWALNLMERALEQVRADFVEAGRLTEFGMLKSFLPGGGANCSYELAAENMGISVPAFKSEVHRLRLKFREIVRSEVARTVSAPHEIELELVHLGRVLMDKSTNLTQTMKPARVNS